MNKFFFALFIASIASAAGAADCIVQNGRQFCANPLPCKTIEGVEYCPKEQVSEAATASTATAQPRVVYVQPQPSIYYGPAYYPYYGPAVVFRFGGGHHRHH